ncbi:MAG: alpha-galactosidase [Bacillota bacterium]|nr:MAG: alpha-galactosidase [Bacillota bacterium]
MGDRAGNLRFRPHPGLGSYDILHDGKHLLDGVHLGVVLEDGTWLPPGTHDGLEVRAHLDTASVGTFEAVLVTLALANHGTKDVGVSAFVPFSAEVPTSGAMFRNGWQSWSFAGCWPVGESDPDQVDLHSLARHGRAWDPGRAVVSDWLTVLGGDPWLALGFVTGRDQFGDLTVEGERLTARSWADRVPVGPGETLKSEVFAMMAGHRDPWAALEALADETGRRARKAAGEPGPPPVPTGWCTWYHYFHGISEESVLADLQGLARLRLTLPLDLFQVDDGYQAAVGNWLETNPKFPRGMRWLAGRVREAGFEPGLWLAPFTVMAGTPAFDNHPEWVLRDESGRPVEAGINWGGPFYGLDVTNPEVEEHLRHVFRTVVRDWGYRYLKLDFIYCASLPGRRHDPRVTRAAALRRGLELVRDEVPEAFVLGCGSPLLPAAGLVDAMRIGPDVAPFWSAPPPLDKDPSFPSAVNSIRNIFARAFTHGRLWVNDPDCLLVREEDSQLTPDEVRTLATAIAFSGGALVLSDAPAALAPERLDLVRRALPPSGRACRLVDPLGGVLPEVAVVPPQVQSEAQAQSCTVAFFNWSDAPEAGRRADIGSALRAAGWRADAWHVFDFWAGRYVGRFSREAPRVPLPDIPPHGCVVLGLTEDRPGVPVVVASDRHVIQGPPFLSQRWDDAGRALTVEVHPGGPERVTVWVAAPSSRRVLVPEPAPRPPAPVSLVGETAHDWGRLLAYRTRNSARGPVTLLRVL